MELQTFASFSDLNLTQFVDACAALARQLTVNDVVLLNGQLGAGKTFFTQSVFNVLGVTSSVSSPTFSIMNQYTNRNGWNFYHLDLYRLQQNDFNTLDHLGFDTIIDKGMIFIEWSERCIDYLKKYQIGDYNVQIDINKNTLSLRNIEISKIQFTPY